MTHQITFVRERVSIRLHVVVLLSKGVDVLISFASIPASLVIDYSSGFGRRIHCEIRLVIYKNLCDQVFVIPIFIKFK